MNSLLLGLLVVIGQATAADSPAIENAFCRVVFSPVDGSLQSIANIPLGDECLKGLPSGASPFRIYMDFTKEYELGDHLEDISRTVLTPGTCRLKNVRRDNSLTLTYEASGLEIDLQVALEAKTGYSDWWLQIRNTSAEPRVLLPSFPYFAGVRLGNDPANNWATIMNQAGSTGPAWKNTGGFYGNGGQFSMQWHALWDPASRSAFGVLFMDPEARAKQLSLEEPNIELSYFPPATIPPGGSLALPPIRVLVYNGDWRPAARAYRTWYDKAFGHAEPPQWFKDSNGCEGRHFKKGGPGVKPDHAGQACLDSFRELPSVQARLPIDHLEYAFYSRGSMIHGKHTDGDNIVREDMGGAGALLEGVNGVHKLGLHTTLYIEGYIVYKESDLAKSGKAERWSVMHKDGSINGNYTDQGFFHMCPGCVEWQDYLAGTVARLLRDTRVDGIRLDSLGFYFLPCYNPAHHHESPFGYNEWIRQLLSKVRTAAIAVNPDALLTTEAPVDFYGQWFHGALTQIYPRDLPPMRLAVGPYRPVAYAQAGPVWGSVSGLIGGRTCWEPDLERLESNWLCARNAVNAALVEGDVADVDPVASDPLVVTRQFRGDGYWAIVAVRPANTDASTWNTYTKLSERREEYTVTLAGLGLAFTESEHSEVALCDVETLTWSPLKPERSGNDLVARLGTNWALLVLPDPEGPSVVDLSPMPAIHPGDSVPMQPTRICGRETVYSDLSVAVPGLQNAIVTTHIGEPLVITVPANALPGLYAIKVTGKNILGTQRFLKIE